MKIFLFFVIILISFSILPSYSQAEDMFILIQIVLRDSQGNLISYLEITKFGYINYQALSVFLDQEATKNDPMFTVNNQQFQIIQRSITKTYDIVDVISDTTLNAYDQNEQLISLVRPIHDGIPGVKGDNLTMIWTFIRPFYS